MIDYSLILNTFFVGKQWTLNGDSYDGFTWFEDTPKPTKEELDALWNDTQIKLKKDDCKTTAKFLLAKTDWAVLPDVQLANSSAFTSYRETLRGFIINPVENPTFPSEPQAVWL